MNVLATLRRAHDRLVICAETSADWALVREMDAAIETVAAMQESHTETLGELIASHRYTGPMPRAPRPINQTDED